MTTASWQFTTISTLSVAPHIFFELINNNHNKNYKCPWMRFLEEKMYFCKIFPLVFIPHRKNKQNTHNHSHIHTV